MNGGNCPQPGREGAPVGGSRRLRVKRFKAWFLFLSTASFLAEAGAGVYATEKAKASAPLPVVWKLDGVTSVAGYNPRVLGAPNLVAEADGGPALRFNGVDDGLVFRLNPLAGWPRFTVEALFLPEAKGPNAQRFFHIEDERASRVTLETRMVRTNSWCLDTYLLCGEKGLPLCDRARLHPAGKWAWVALVYDGKRMSSYVNGVKELEGKVRFTPMRPGQVSLGVRLNEVYWFQGSLKEFRFTPAALAAAALQRVP